MSVLPSPADLGLPARFGSWRNGQDQAVLAALDSPKRFVVQCAPTGFGKTIAYMAQAMLSGKRTAFLTATKGLETQLVDDFSESGLFDIRGQNNYPCKELGVGGRYRGEGLNAGDSCDAGPCHAGVRCHWRNGGCHYYDALNQALGSWLVTTNYSYWVTQNRYSEGLGSFGLLVLDEAHRAPDELAAMLQTELFEPDLNALLKIHFPKGDEIQEWILWAKDELDLAGERLAELEQQVRLCREDQKISKQLLREIFGLRTAIRRLEIVAKIEGHWIVERHGKAARIAPVWPAPYAEEYLFTKIPKVVLVSATIQAKTLELLGVKPGEFDFFEYPSTFPVARRPVIHVPSGVRCRHGWDESEQKTWVCRIDQIIDRRLDRKGIIHTVSYERRDLILKYSHHRELMMINSGRDTRDVVDDFKRAKPPLILVSPSMTTGWDLPMEECEYAIIAKIPFPDTRSRVTKARTAEDANYGPYLAMLTIVQASGRGMRSADDQCETLIVDDMWTWFWARFKPFAPRWFQNAVRRVVTVPDPLPKLKKETIYG